MIIAVYENVLNVYENVFENEKVESLTQCFFVV